MRAWELLVRPTAPERVDAGSTGRTHTRPVYLRRQQAVESVDDGDQRLETRNAARAGAPDDRRTGA